MKPKEKLIKMSAWPTTAEIVRNQGLLSSPFPPQIAHKNCTK